MTVEALTPLAERVSNSLVRDDGLCPACFPKRVVTSESHHILPQHLGGAPDSPQVMLCGSCHTLIHTSALKMARQEEPDNLTPTQSILVKMIVKCMFADQPNSAELPRHIMFTVPDLVLKKMHKRKLDTGFTNLTEYVKSLIMRDIGEL